MIILTIWFDSEENKKTIFIYHNYVGTSIQKHYFFIHDYFFLLNDNYHILINLHALTLLQVIFLRFCFVHVYFHLNFNTILRKKM